MKTRALFILIVLCGLGIAAYVFPFRWDLTEDHRYSLSQPSKDLLTSLDEPLYISCLLEGELNAGFVRLKQAVQDWTDEMSVYAQVHDYTLSEADKQALGLRPTLIHERTKKGQTAQTQVYPYAVLQYKGRQAVIPLLSNNRSLSGEENLNNSIAGLEYAFTEAIHGLQSDSVPYIAFLEGQGELPELQVMDITNQLSRYFTVHRGALSHQVGEIDRYAALIIADPQQAFSEQDKYILDQYVMQGGRILWVLNGVQFSNEVLAREGYTPVIELDLNIKDMLFRYGIRIDPALVQDIQCLPIPVDVSADPSQPNYQPMPWYYAPLLLTSYGSPITRNCMQVACTFASPIEAVGGDDGIDKTILLATSTASRVIRTPAEVNLGDMNPEMEEFKYQYLPIAVSLEGCFPSLFAHRMMPEGIVSSSAQRSSSIPTRQVVIACGGMIRNDVQQGQALPLGYDRYSGMQFGNRDVLVNALLWLTDKEGLMSLRQKDISLRLINSERAYTYVVGIQIMTIVLPLLLLIALGAIVWIVRKNKYIQV